MTLQDVASHYNVNICLKNIPQNMSCFNNFFKNKNVHGVFKTLVIMFNEYLLSILSSLDSFQIIPHFFIIYYKYCHDYFQWLMTLIQILTLKHAKLNTSYNYFGSYYYDYTLLSTSSLKWKSWSIA